MIRFLSFFCVLSESIPVETHQVCMISDTIADLLNDNQFLAIRDVEDSIMLDTADSSSFSAAAFVCSKHMYCFNIVYLF